MWTLFLRLYKPFTSSLRSILPDYIFPKIAVSGRCVSCFELFTYVVGRFFVLFGLLACSVRPVVFFCSACWSGLFSLLVCSVPVWWLFCAACWSGMFSLLVCSVRSVLLFSNPPPAACSSACLSSPCVFFFFLLFVLF